MPTRLLHVSDTHLGNRQYGSDIRREDFAQAFEQAVGRAVEAGVDAVLHTGDLFHSREPRLPDLNRCIDTLQTLAEAGIPFYGIVGNHERKMGDQYLDLINRTGTARRLSRAPTVIGEAAVYGIDAVTRPAWPGEDFALEPPPEGAVVLLCMHQLLNPPVPEIQANHPIEDVLERVNVDVDAIALGDYHESAGTVVHGTKVWYAGSTERCSTREADPRSVSLLEIENGRLQRQKLELDTRPFLSFAVRFGENDDRGHAASVVTRHPVEDSVVTVAIEGEETGVTARDVREMVLERGATVCRVRDTRESGGPAPSGGPAGAVQSVDRRIEEHLADRTLSDLAGRIDRRIRTEPVTISTFADEIRSLVADAQKQAFAEEPDAEDAGAESAGAEDAGAEDAGAEDAGAEDAGAGEGDAPGPTDADVPAGDEAPADPDAAPPESSAADRPEGTR